MPTSSSPRPSRLVSAAHPEMATPAYRLQRYALRDFRGSLEEVEPALAELMASYPARPMFRCALAHLYARVARTADARREFEELAMSGIASSVWRTAQRASPHQRVRTHTRRRRHSCQRRSLIRKTVGHRAARQKSRDVTRTPTPALPRELGTENRALLVIGNDEERRAAVLGSDATIIGANGGDCRGPVYLVGGGSRWSRSQ